jgi:hypothetical protein
MASAVRATVVIVLDVGVGVVCAFVTRLDTIGAYWMHLQGVCQ